VDSRPAGLHPWVEAGPPTGEVVAASKFHRCTEDDQAVPQQA